MPENQQNRKEEDKTPVVGGGYVVFQLSKALTTETHDSNPDTRQRAHQRVQNWAQVFEGIVNGSLAVGSRTPLTGVPGWVTLQVMTGGFATGGLLAGGSLEKHERLLLEKLPSVPEEDARRALNRYYLTDAGLAELQSLLESSAYTVNLPEEGALLVVAWLVQNGHQESARILLETLGAWFSRLRFYPLPAQVVHQSGSRVSLQNVGETIESLKRIQPNQMILAQQEMVCVWTPLYDSMVQLFLETIDGELPSLECDAEGRWVRSSAGKFPVKGGWPCQHYPTDWSDRATALLAACGTARSTHKLSQRPERDGDNFAVLWGYLQRCAENPASLQGRDVGRIRQILACYLNKRGSPDSPQCQDLRKRQHEHASAPTYQQIARVLIPRLQTFPREYGLDIPALVTQTISKEEAAHNQIPAGTPIPETLQYKVERCLRETVDVLIERGLITSGDTLAKVLPQITADIRAVGFTDPTLRRLFVAIYSAFRRRRSLLLLNLEHQIQIEELPWIACLDRFRQRDLPGRESARQTLEEVSLLTLTAFPHAILPNKLLQELHALAKAAELDLPLVEELAADIFMGKFSLKYLAAAHQAAALLDKTLYAVYYGIDYQTLPVIKPKSFLGLALFGLLSTDTSFGELCVSRAGVRLGGWNPAVNGMVIEQQQILTTQNLAVLFKEFHFTDVLGEQLDLLPRSCFKWICQRLQMKTDRWHAHLIQVKNTAYAWRQMIFFLALLSKVRQTSFLLWAEDHLKEQSPAFQERFKPALLGLAYAIDGQSLESQDAVQAGAKRFLGWSKDKHWLLIER